MYQAKYGVISFSGGQKIKVVQNGVKHVLISDFLRSDEIECELTTRQTTILTTTHPVTMLSVWISRFAR